MLLGDLKGWIERFSSIMKGTNELKASRLESLSNDFKEAYGMTEIKRNPILRQMYRTFQEARNT